MSFLRGSVSLSSSLRDAFPPIFRARLCESKGPNIFIACAIAPSNSVVSHLTLTKTAWYSLERSHSVHTEKARILPRILLHLLSAEVLCRPVLGV